MKYTTTILSVLMTFAGVGALAAPGGGPGWQRPMMSRTWPIAGAEEVVRQGLEGLVAFMGQRPRPTGMKLAAYLKEQIAGRFDFDFMTRVALGPMRHRMARAQQADLVQKIEQDFLQTLTRHLASYRGQQLRFFPPHQGRANRTRVGVAILNPRGYPSRLDFRLYYGRAGWKVYDVVANGNSAVGYYREKILREWRGPYAGRRR